MNSEIESSDANGVGTDSLDGLPFFISFEGASDLDWAAPLEDPPKPAFNIAMCLKNPNGEYLQIKKHYAQRSELQESYIV